MVGDSAQLGSPSRWGRVELPCVPLWEGLVKFWGIHEMEARPAALPLCPHLPLSPVVELSVASPVLSLASLLASC